MHNNTLFTVLLVEDDLNDIFLVKRAFKMAHLQNPLQVVTDGQEAINYLKDRVNGHGGMIVLDSKGRFGIAHNTPRMAWALRTAAEERWAIELT